MGGGGLFEIGRPRSKRWRKFGRRWTSEVGGLENWTIFMDVIYLSSLKRIEKSYDAVSDGFWYDF